MFEGTSKSRQCYRCKMGIFIYSAHVIWCHRVVLKGSTKDIGGASNLLWVCVGLLYYFPGSFSVEFKKNFLLATSCHLEPLHSLTGASFLGKVKTISKFGSLIPCVLWDTLCLITGENAKVIKVIMKVLYSKQKACCFYNLLWLLISDVTWYLLFLLSFLFRNVWKPFSARQSEREGILYSPWILSY